MTIAELVESSHRVSLQHGWYDLQTVDGKIVEELVPIPEKLCLVHSEISEALEAFRDHGLLCVAEPKPEGFVIELADAVIRIADLCGALGLDLEHAIRNKQAYNANRPYRHGGKRC